jgi:mRNA-degrading endonuclease toxin of MazEF toxin-antitoxin module
MIYQEEIYWIDLGEPNGSEPAYLRPYVVIHQRTRINLRSMIFAASS